MKPIIKHTNVSTSTTPIHQVEIKFPFFVKKVGVGSTPFKAFINAIIK